MFSPGKEICLQLLEKDKWFDEEVVILVFSLITGPDVASNNRETSPRSHE